MQTVVHLISGDESEQDTALSIARNLLGDGTGSVDDIAVVAQSDGIEVLTTNGKTQDRVQSLTDDGVSSRPVATQWTRWTSATDLIETVETVPEGAVEVTRLENEGYGSVRP